jgi:hypothetical protein
VRRMGWASTLVRGAGRSAAVLAAGVLAGCGQAEPAYEHEVATVCASEAPRAVIVSASLREGRAAPSPRRVEVPLDGQVQVRVSTDREVEVHVHGYDFTFVAKPSAPGCISFIAERAGLFDVEAHPETLLAQLEVR